MTVMMGGRGRGCRTEKPNFSFEQQQAGNVESDGAMHVSNLDLMAMDDETS
jgi:hypothetical protein